MLFHGNQVFFCTFEIWNPPGFFQGLSDWQHIFQSSPKTFPKKSRSKSFSARKLKSRDAMVAIRCNWGTWSFGSFRCFFFFFFSMFFGWILGVLGIEIWKISSLIFSKLANWYSDSFRVYSPTCIVFWKSLFDPSTSHVIRLCLNVDMTLSGRLSLLTILSLHVSSSTKKYTTRVSRNSMCFSTCNPTTKRGGLQHFLCIVMHHRPVTAPLSSSAPLSPSEMPVGRLDVQQWEHRHHVRIISFDLIGTYRDSHIMNIHES